MISEKAFWQATCQIPKKKKSSDGMKKIFFFHGMCHWWKSEGVRSKSRKKTSTQDKTGNTSGRAEIEPNRDCLHMPTMRTARGGIVRRRPSFVFIQLTFMFLFVKFSSSSLSSCGRTDTCKRNSGMRLLRLACSQT